MVREEIARFVKRSGVAAASLFVAELCASHDAGACAVCFGNAASPMTRAALAGVAVLLAVVGTVLLAAAVLAFRWARRERALQGGTRRLA